MAVGLGSKCGLKLENKKLLFVAGGIGITPFMSYYSAIKELKIDVQITLLFACRGDDVLLANYFADLPSGRIKIFQTGKATTQDLKASSRIEEYVDLLYWYDVADVILLGDV